MVTSRNRCQCDALPRYEGRILTVSKEALSITEQFINYGIVGLA